MALGTVYTELICIHRFVVYMEPKLYWRIKKNGKWTWERAVMAIMSTDDIRNGVRHDNPNTVGYGSLGCFRYKPQEEEE